MSEKIEYGSWDIVKLKGRTGRYRVYKWLNHFVFACLDADVMTVDSRDEVEEVLEKAV